MSRGNLTAVVTGCGAGIGRAVSERLSSDGFLVIGVERDEDLASDVTAEGIVVEAVIGDAGRRSIIEQAIERANDGERRLGAWVNNAAYSIQDSLHCGSPRTLTEIIHAGLLGYYWGCAAAIKSFLFTSTTGSIVNVSSIHGTVSFPGYAAYDMVKGGVDALTRGVAVNYGEHGIRANAVAPGSITTPAVKRHFAEQLNPVRAREESERLAPLNRMGLPSEVASVVSFLISTDASFISGQVIAVDGGATIFAKRGSPPAHQPF